MILLACVQGLFSSRMLKGGPFNLVRPTVFREIGLIPPRQLEGISPPSEMSEIYVKESGHTKNRCCSVDVYPRTAPAHA